MDKGTRQLTFPGKLIVTWEFFSEVTSAGVYGVNFRPFMLLANGTRLEVQYTNVCQLGDEVLDELRSVCILAVAVSTDTKEDIWTSSICKNLLSIFKR